MNKIDASQTLITKKEIDYSESTNNKQRVKDLMNDNKKRKLSDVAEELDIHPREVKQIFNELDTEGYFNSTKNEKNIKESNNE